LLGVALETSIRDASGEVLGQTKTRARQLCIDLRAQSLENKSMREFLGQIKNIAD